MAKWKQLAVDYPRANLTEGASKKSLPRLGDYSGTFRECNSNQWCGGVAGVDVCLAHMNVLVILNFPCGKILLVPL